MLRELVTRPIGAVIALIELPVTMQRSLKQANDLMEASRRQLEAMQHQTDDALLQAERMNDLLGRVVKLTEPIEIAQRGSEYVGGRLKRALFGEGPEAAESPPSNPAGGEHAATMEYSAGGDRSPSAAPAKGAAERFERAVADAEAAAGDAELAANEAESAADHAEEEAEAITELEDEARGAGTGPGKEARGAAGEGRDPEQAEEGTREPGEEADADPGGWRPAGSRQRADGGGLDVPDSATIRVIPNQPPPGERE